MTRAKCGAARLPDRRVRAVHEGASDRLEVNLTD
jgi:hypothetical protein